MATHENTTANFSLITVSVHCLPKRLWLLVLPTAFPTTYSQTSHKISFAVLPVSDCVSTPFALRLQHGTPGPPLPVICVRLMTMSRMNSMLFSTAQCLFAGGMSACSQRREHRMFLHFCTRTTTNSIVSTLTDFFYEQASTL